MLKLEKKYLINFCMEAGISQEAKQYIFFLKCSKEVNKKTMLIQFKPRKGQDCKLYQV
jgi:hypothetical protein